jgi:hypothetical protein
MRTVVILTFPQPQAKATLDTLEEMLRDRYTGVEWMLVDQCSGATVINLPDKE